MTVDHFSQWMGVSGWQVRDDLVGEGKVGRGRPAFLTMDGADPTRKCQKSEENSPPRHGNQASGRQKIHAPYP